MRDKIKGRRLNWAEMRATRFSRSLRRRHCEIGVFVVLICACFFAAIPEKNQLGVTKLEVGSARPRGGPRALPTSTWLTPN